LTTDVLAHHKNRNVYGTHNIFQRSGVDMYCKRWHVRSARRAECPTIAFVYIDLNMDYWESLLATY
jgi:hypothetical protein